MHTTFYYLPADFSEEIEKQYKNLKEIKYLNDFDIFEDVTISLTRGFLVDGVFNSKQELLTAYSRWDDFSLIPQNNLIPKEDISNVNNTISETVIYGGLMVGHFGHFITDTLNRLWYLIKYKKEKYKIVFTHFKYHEYDLRPFQNEFMNLLGIESDRILVIDKPTRFNKVIVPKQSVFWNSSYNRELLSLIFDDMVSKVEPKKFEKIYISKSKVQESDSFTLNEKYFETFFSAQGFEIIYPETLPVKEQISYISGAKEIACTSGTLSHLVLFARKDVKLICLLRSNLDLWITFINRQVIINMIKDVNCIFVDVSINFIPLVTVNNTHLIGPSSYWKDFLKSEYEIDINLDIYEYLDSAGVKLGSYLKKYITTIKGYKFGYISYYLSMLRTFHSNDYNRNLRSLYSHQAFTTNSFRFKKLNDGSCSNIRLTQDGYIITLNGRNNIDECHWLYMEGKLYFLNYAFQALEEFIVYPFETGTLVKQKRFLGNAIANPRDAYELVEIQHRFLRVIIKLLVSKKRYKKLKRDPVNFFKDSKSGFIKYLGRFYL